METLPPNIAAAEWLRKAETQAVFAALEAEGHRARAVGGAVRNTLMGLAVADIDIATTAAPEKVMALAQRAGLASVPTGLKHGTVTVIANHMPFEVTTLREDIKTYGRHADVAFTEDWAADARRRDFTMNALYCGADGTVLDPLGGYDDLAARRVRFIGTPEDRISEDYLRILRFYRFTAEYVSGAPDVAGHQACVAQRQGLARISGERINAEMQRLLVARGGVGVVRCMQQAGILAATGLADNPSGVERLETLARTEARLERTPSAVLRLAALWVRDEASAETAGRRLKLSNAEQNRLRMAAVPQPKLTSRTPERQARQVLYELGEASYRDRVLLTWAGEPSDESRFAAWLDIYQLPDRWPAPEFPLKGADAVAAGLAAGPLVGEVLRKIEGDWIAADFMPGRDQLLERLKAEIARRTGAKK